MPKKHKNKFKAQAQVHHKGWTQFQSSAPSGLPQTTTTERSQQSGVFGGVDRSLRPVVGAPTLIFSVPAWLKLQYLCHLGHTEVGGFGVTKADDLLYVEEFHTVPQETSAAFVSFRDEGVADFFEDCADRGIEPRRCGRIWIHTHPGASPHPSGTDVSTFDRSFGTCDWSVMFILSRTSNVYARLRFSAGPGLAITIPTTVDWESWRGDAADVDKAAWEAEYRKNVSPRYEAYSAGIGQSYVGGPSRSDKVVYSDVYGSRWSGDRSNGSLREESSGALGFEAFGADGSVKRHRPYEPGEHGPYSSGGIIIPDYEDSLHISEQEKAQKEREADEAEFREWARSWNEYVHASDDGSLRDLDEGELHELEVVEEGDRATNQVRRSIDEFRRDARNYRGLP